MRLKRLFVVILLYFTPCVLQCLLLECIAFGQAPAKRPLTEGIQRNQQELQQIVGMINENKKEQAWVLTEALADAASLVTDGALKQVDDSEQVSKILEIIKNAANTVGKLTDFADAADDFKTGNLGLEVSDALKELLDLLGSNPALAEIGIANTVNDLGIKAMQWRALQVENDELLKVVAKLTVAQNQLLAKDPATRARVEAAARKASQDAEERQRTQAELLRQYYKDKPNAIQLAVRQAAARGSQQGVQVAQGIGIAGGNSRPLDLSDIPGINPDAVEAMRRCNAIALTMACRFDNLVTLRQTCPKADNPEDVPPPCPVYEHAAARNAAIDAASMTCNKYSDGSYIPFFGPPRGIAAMSTMPSGSSLQAGCGQQMSRQAEPAPSNRPTRCDLQHPDWAAVGGCSQAYNQCAATCRTPLGLICGSCYMEYHRCRCSACACD